MKDIILKKGKTNASRISIKLNVIQAEFYQAFRTSNCNVVITGENIS